MYIPTYREIIQRLEREGWVMQRQDGSHKQFFKYGKRITVSGSGGKQPSVGQWKDIMRKAGW